MFVVLLRFSEPLARDRTKCPFLNDEPCLAWPTLIDLNPVELKYYLFGISFDICTGSYHVHLQKHVFEKKQKTNFKAFNLITNKTDAKTVTKHISCDFKCKFNSKKCNSNQKWNNETCQWKCKNYRKCKNYYSWNPTTGICENSKYLKSIGHTSVIKCDENIAVMDIVSTKMTNAVATNVTSTASINCHNIKVRVCYVLHTVLLMIILLLIIITNCYNYTKQRGINVPAMQNGKQWILKSLYQKSYVLLFRWHNQLRGFWYW